MLDVHIISRKDCHLSVEVWVITASLSLSSISVQSPPLGKAYQTSAVTRLSCGSHWGGQWLWAGALLTDSIPPFTKLGTAAKRQEVHRQYYSWHLYGKRHARKITRDLKITQLVQLWQGLDVLYPKQWSVELTDAQSLELETNIGFNRLLKIIQPCSTSRTCQPQSNIKLLRA